MHSESGCGEGGCGEGGCGEGGWGGGGRDGVDDECGPRPLTARLTDAPRPTPQGEL